MVNMRNDGTNLVFQGCLQMQFVTFIVKIFNFIIQLMDRMNNEMLYGEDD